MTEVSLLAGWQDYPFFYRIGSVKGHGLNHSIAELRRAGIKISPERG